MPRPKRRPTKYVCVGIEFWADVDREGLTLQAARLYQEILMKCMDLGIEGVISRSTIRSIGLPGYWHSLKLLIRSGWIVDKGNDEFHVRGWSNWNDSLEDVYARRKADRDRKRVKQRIPPGMYRMPD